MCMPYLIEIRPSHRKGRGRRVSPGEQSPPPCIITIEPRSPRLSQGNCSQSGGGLHIDGEASLQRKQEQRKSNQPSPKPKPSPRSPPRQPSTCKTPKASRSSSSSSSTSSSSSSISRSSFQNLQHEFEQVVKRVTNLEKELSADRARANQNMSVTAGRVSKTETEVGGLKEVVMGFGKELQMLQKDVMKFKEACGRDGREAAEQGEDARGGRRVRVEWERVRRWPREASR